MKKTLTLTAICLTTTLFAQFNNLNLVNVFSIDPQTIYLENNAITIPEGKLWRIAVMYENGVTDTNINSGNKTRIKTSNSDVSTTLISSSVNTTSPYLYPANSLLWTDQSSIPYGWVFMIYEYELGNINGLGFNDNINNKIKLFPNPTTSKIALNSDKDYEIQIFDMTGNKVMETIGNTIDLSVLSSAMYIVKTLDKMTKETNSYKVVKN